MNKRERGDEGIVCSVMLLLCVLSGCAGRHILAPRLTQGCAISFAYRDLGMRGDVRVYYVEDELVFEEWREEKLVRTVTMPREMEPNCK